MHFQQGSKLVKNPERLYLINHIQFSLIRPACVLVCKFILFSSAKVISYCLKSAELLFYVYLSFHNADIWFNYANEAKNRFKTCLFALVIEK